MEVCRCKRTEKRLRLLSRLTLLSFSISRVQQRYYVAELDDEETAGGSPWVGNLFQYTVTA